MDMAQEKKVVEVGANNVLLAKASGGGAGYFPVATPLVKLSGNSDNAGDLRSNGRHPSPYAVQVIVEGAMAGDPIPMAPVVMAGGNLSAVVGIVAASTAVTAVAGGAVSPVVAFGSFLVLLGGLALAMTRVPRFV